MRKKRCENWKCGKLRSLVWKVDGKKICHECFERWIDMLARQQSYVEEHEIERLSDLEKDFGEARIKHDD